MNDSPDWIARAPGKLILTGEHAVVYGSPALAMAIERWVEVRLSARSDDRIRIFSREFPIHFDFSWRDFHLPNTHTELIPHALDVFSKRYPNALFQGADIYIASDLWSGSGMGSSAALILALLKVLSCHWDITMSDAELRALSIEIEHLQHGRSSGLDVTVCSTGGLGWYTSSSGVLHAHPRKPFSLPFLLIHTGAPISTTTECVNHAMPMLQSNKALLGEFSKIAYDTDAALQQTSLAHWKIAMRDNHQLLCDIGVVPPVVRTFIQEIENIDGAAKISGAGSIRGSSAGTVIAIHHDLTVLRALAEHHGFSHLQTHGSSRGVHVV